MPDPTASEVTIKTSSGGFWPWARANIGVIFICIGGFVTFVGGPTYFLITLYNRYTSLESWSKKKEEADAAIIKQLNDRIDKKADDKTVSAIQESQRQRQDRQLEQTNEVRNRLTAIEVDAAYEKGFQDAMDERGKHKH